MAKTQLKFNTSKTKPRISSLRSFLVHIWEDQHFFTLRIALGVVRDSLTSRALSVMSFTDNLASSFHLSCLNLKLFPHVPPRRLVVYCPSYFQRVLNKGYCCGLDICPYISQYRELRCHLFYCMWATFGIQILRVL